MMDRYSSTSLGTRQAWYINQAADNIRAHFQEKREARKRLIRRLKIAFVVFAVIWSVLLTVAIVSYKMGKSKSSSSEAGLPSNPPSTIVEGNNPVTPSPVPSSDTEEDKIEHSSKTHHPTSAPANHTSDTLHPSQHTSSRPSLRPSIEPTSRPSRVSSNEPSPFVTTPTPTALLSLTPSFPPSIVKASSLTPTIVPPGSDTSLPLDTTEVDSPLGWTSRSEPRITPAPALQSTAGRSYNRTNLANRKRRKPTRRNPATYVPGQLTVSENGLLLSTGLTARIIAKSGEHVPLHDGTTSTEKFHVLPDMGATFKQPDGGWIYVSNCENRNKTKGGVGAITFDKHGNVLGYKMLLTGSTSNCGGGKTYWRTWISGEETQDGHLWEVDPTGRHPPKTISMGSGGGFFESFAYDRNRGYFFATEDAPAGPLRRFKPVKPNWRAPWSVLHGEGQIDYLILTPSSGSPGSGTYKWTSDKAEAQATVEAVYPNSEGIDVNGDYLYLISKVPKTMFILNLASNTYTSCSTHTGLFDGQPDQIVRVFGSRSKDLLFFTEDGGRYAGIHARNGHNQFFTVFESEVYPPETTGLSFSPDYMHMYVAYQKPGVLFDVTRKDGFPFNADALSVKYHSSDRERS